MKTLLAILVALFSAKNVKFDVIDIDDTKGDPSRVMLETVDGWRITVEKSPHYGVTNVTGAPHITLPTNIYLTYPLYLPSCAYTNQIMPAK